MIEAEGVIVSGVPAQMGIRISRWMTQRWTAVAG